MSITDMVQRINEEADAEVKLIIDKAKKDAARFSKENKEEVEREIKELNGSLKKEIRSIVNINISNGKRISRAVLLSAKEEVILRTVSLVRKELGDIDTDVLERYLFLMYDQAVRLLGEDIMIFPVREIDFELLKEKKGIKAVIGSASSLPEKIMRFRSTDLIGGFIASTTDGSRILNMSFAGLIEREEEAIREIIARVLFVE